PSDELIRCIAAGEKGRLEKIPGIGKKTADQILLSLGEKVLSLLDPDEEVPAVAAQGRPDAMIVEANAVLVGLGWRSKQVDKALTQVTQSDDWVAKPASLDELVRRTLAQLMER
ncbi:MAG TPA: hypothetical protein ENJ18_03465, partial [Nannocystis exedens]|nr:hypothetical protein [Nannocystis exedens]